LVAEGLRNSLPGACKHIQWRIHWRQPKTAAIRKRNYKREGAFLVHQLAQDRAGKLE
jgi:hypothetical protein